MISAAAWSISSVGQGEAFRVRNTYCRSAACGAPFSVAFNAADKTEKR